MERKKHILVADDERLLRKLTANILSSAGFEVTTCATGAEALKFYAKNQVDLVILDMIMPGLNGAETFRSLISADPKAKVIILSGFTREQVTKELYELGLAGFLDKPVSRVKLLMTVQEVLSS